jgi:tetratricopeptide (TPR) repeat protein
MRRAVLLSFLALAAACAPPKPIPAPVVSAPKFPEFMTPAIPPAFVGGPVSAIQDRGWRFLQAGDTKNAEREFTLALRAVPAFYPADAGLGYVELARQNGKGALLHFDRVLEQERREVSALVGRGQTLLMLERETEALKTFEAALAVDPSLTEVARRIEVLRFRGQQEDLNNARQAARGGRLEEAISLYGRAIDSSPESPFLYRELATVERRLGQDDRALEHLRRAAVLEPDDAKSLVQIGEILESRDDVEGAAKAYSEALAFEPNAGVESRLDGVRARIELARLPEEYRAIEQAPQITRADLAALVGVRLGALLKATPRRDAVLVTDIRTNWASTWILMVAKAGVMEPFANHAFQPNAVVRRADLAQVVSRLLDRVAETAPTPSASWQSARIAFSDLAASHLAYPAASAAVASGVMTNGPNNSFQPSAPVSGQEAGDAIGRLEIMVRNLIGTGKIGR